MDQNYLEFEYNEKLTNEIVSDLSYIQTQYLKCFDISGYINSLKGCTGWSRLGNSSTYISRLNTYNNNIRNNYPPRIEKERNRIKNTLIALK